MSKRAIDPTRRAAYDLQHAVNAEDAYANIAWPDILTTYKLTGRDAAFATELAYGTLRWRALYDAIIESQLDMPLAKLDPMVLDVLRLGAHQLLGMRVGTHAAVDESVSLAHNVRGEGPARLTNAVLRKIAAKDRESWTAQVVGQSQPDRLALEWSHPRWIVSAYRDTLGCSWDELEPLLEVDNQPGEVTLVARDMPVDELAVLTGGRRGRWSPRAVVLDSGAATAVDAVRDGRAGVQDEGSQLMALALANAEIEGTDARWLDMCAGPGGKAALLAAIARDRGARLTAVEVHEHRAELVSKALARFDVDVVCADATDVLWPEPFDRILLDVPCTGIGVVRRRPDLRWRRTADDVSRVVPIQQALLEAAIRAVRVGGVIGYVTCSPHIAETDLLVDDVLKSHPQVLREDARALLPGVEHLGPGPDVRLWPHLHGTDGMYLALLRKQS